MIHISEVTNIGSVNVCISVYRFVTETELSSKNLPFCEEVTVRATKDPLSTTNPVYKAMHTSISRICNCEHP